MFRLVPFLALLVATLACQKYSHRLPDTAEGEGEGDTALDSPCEGAALVVQSDLTNDSADAALPIDTGGADLVLFGNTDDDGATFASLEGFFAAGGYTPGQSVLVQAVNNPCASTGCPSTVGFRFFDTINVTNPSGTCGSTTVTADADGELLFRATGGGTGGGGGGGTGGGGGGGTGPNGPNVGVRLTPQ